MPHNWVIVKNSRKGGHRPIEEYQAELESALRTFERECGVQVDRSVRQSLGVSEFQLQAERDKAYTHPFPHLSSHGDYLFGCFSVPADIDNGKADFSSIFVVVTNTHLLTIFKDPYWVYNAYFGGAVLSLHARHSESGSDRVATTLLKLLGFTVSALDHTFDALGNRSRKYEMKVGSISERDGRGLEQAISRNLSSLISLKTEVTSMSTVTHETASILSRIESGRVRLRPDDESSASFFDLGEQHFANGLFVHAAQVDSYRRDLVGIVSDSIAKVDRLQEKSLVLATHRVTALGAMILFPNLIFDFFGQGFAPLPDWFQNNGWWFTVGLTVAYWGGQYAYMRRRRYI